MLLGFGGVALFVGAFVIFNTLSITVAQRTREFATLRTLGGSRKQVLGSVVIEGFVIGLLASTVGLFLGLAVGKGMNLLFVAMGVDLPQAGTVFATRTIVVSLVVGTTVTVVASIVPALRATRVPPISAVREGSIPPQSRFAPYAPYVALTTIALAIVSLGVGLFVSGLETPVILLLLGVGAISLFLGVALLASRLVKPLAAIVGWPALRLGGMAGELARENSIRNPGRTASTAAALMIGLALVTVVAVLGAALRDSTEGAVRDQVAADYVVTSQNGFDPLPAAVGDAVASTDGVELASSVRYDQALADTTESEVTGVDPADDRHVLCLRVDGGLRGDAGGARHGRSDRDREVRGGSRPGRGRSLPGRDGERRDARRGHPRRSTTRPTSLRSSVRSRSARRHSTRASRGRATSSRSRRPATVTSRRSRAPSRASRTRRSTPSRASCRAGRRSSRRS